MKHDALGGSTIPPGSTDLLDVLLETTGHLLTHREMKQGRNEGRERERKGKERKGEERRGERRIEGKERKRKGKDRVDRNGKEWHA